MPSEMGVAITPSQENMLRRGLSILSKDRPQNIRELKMLLDPEREVVPQVIAPHHPDARSPKLFVVYNHSDWEFHLQGEQTLGRPSSTTSPDLELNIRSVSRRHGIFRSDSKKNRYLYISDIASTNGTRLNGSMLPAGEETELHSGDVLTIRPQKKSRQFDVTMIFSTAYARDTEWRYIGINGDTKEIILGMQSLSRVGRGGFDIQYASLFFINNECAVIDHGKNDIYVNNRKINQVQYLEPMDVISVRGYYLVYTGQSLMYQTESSAPYLSEIAGKTMRYRDEEHSFFSVRVEERNLWKRFRKNTVFRNYKIRVEQGSLVLIMGGTDILEGIVDESALSEEASNMIRIPENQELEQSYRRMKDEIACVFQNDDLRSDGRVYDLISQSVARTGLRRDSDRHKARVIDILRFFQLDRIMNHHTGELKFSQRRILRIALEYARNPSLLFVDFPDSGMDRQTASQILRILRRIANQGKIVLMTSNRPDTESALFDLIFVLGQNMETGERTLEFAGPKNDALRYFRTGNLEDILQKVYLKNSRKRP